MLVFKRIQNSICVGLVAVLALGMVESAHAAPTQIPAPSVSSDTKYSYYMLNTTGFAPGTVFRILIDTDTNPTTGFGYGLGADYMLQNETLYKHIGSGKLWNWVPIKKVSYTVSSTSVKWKVEINDIDNATLAIVRSQTPSPTLASSLVTQRLPYRTGTIAPFPTAVMKMPTNVVSGARISLNCGTLYYGTLNLQNLANVTVETNGACGPAVLTPVQPVPNRWRVYKGNIYVTDVPQQIGQVFVDGQHASVAHFPNSLREIGWLQPTNITATTMDVDGLQYLDVVGAKATFRGIYPWSIGTRDVTKFDGKTLTLPIPTNKNILSENSEDLGKFYLEGKLWMLDAPGEWAWHEGKLYIYMPDGLAPGSRVHAGPLMESVIDARGSTSVHLNNIRVIGGYVGVDGSWTDRAARGAADLQIRNTEIAYSEWSGIYATDSKNLYVDQSRVIGALHTGIYARYGTDTSMVLNSTFININMIGMHKGSDGSIYINADSHARILNNLIQNSGKTGIFLGQSTSSVIRGNTVDGACRIHGDCGGIYVFSRNKNYLDTYIESNTVKNVAGEPVRPNSTNPERYGIYLDDYATGVNVLNNTITDNDSGLQLHLSFINIIQGNTFARNSIRHVLMADSGGEHGSMKVNIFRYNKFYGPVLGFTMAVANPEDAANFNGNYFYNYSSYDQMVDRPGVPIH